MLHGVRVPFLHKRPTARDLISASLTRRDYNSAAVVIMAGTFSVLQGAAQDTNESTASERTLRLAVARLQAHR